MLQDIEKNPDYNWKGRVIWKFLPADQTIQYFDIN